MALNYGPIYRSVSDITGPSGFYNIKYNSTYVTVYVDQEYAGGGWVCVMANRKDTGGITNLTYNNAVNTCNYRSGTSPGTNTIVSPTSGLSGLANYNIFIGVSYWPFLGNRSTPGRIDVVQFVANTNGTALGNTSAHTKRYRWKFDYFNSTYGMVGAAGISDETSTGAPGMYSYHAANAFSLSTYDNDQDPYGSGNCSAFYSNSAFWYGDCWSGNVWGGGPSNYYQDAYYWNSSGDDYHQYGAVYIK
jgi:hypothetical protein